MVEVRGGGVEEETVEGKGGGLNRACWCLVCGDLVEAQSCSADKTFHFGKEISYFIRLSLYRYPRVFSKKERPAFEALLEVFFWEVVVKGHVAPPRALASSCIN